MGSMLPRYAAVPGFRQLPMSPSVSCPCMDVLHAHSIKKFRHLLLSRDVSRCLLMSTTRLNLLPNHDPKLGANLEAGQIGNSGNRSGLRGEPLHGHLDVHGRPSRLRTFMPSRLRTFTPSRLAPSRLHAFAPSRLHNQTTANVPLLCTQNADYKPTRTQSRG